MSPRRRIVPVVVLIASVSACGSSSSDDGAIAGDGGAPDAADHGNAPDGALTDAGPLADGNDANADAGAGAYDRAVLADGPVAFWAMSRFSGTEPDLTGNGHTGVYEPTGTTLADAVLPNGERAATFDGATQSLRVPSAAAFSIATTKTITLEGWVALSTLQFPHEESSGYVHWLGKGTAYGSAGNQEWMMRIYSVTNTENPMRPNRFSAYAFNPTGALGSGAFWQPTTNPQRVTIGKWFYVVAVLTTATTPSGCPSGAPGSVAIWIDGRREANTPPTGCMSQYGVVPVAGAAPIGIGSGSLGGSYFAGAVGKVAIYDRALTDAQIAAHCRAMSSAAFCTSPP